jgi:uncharacterized protein
MLTIEEARQYYPSADSAHDFDHVLRVLALAERLAHAEGAEVEIVRAAALLHDVARADEDAGRVADHAASGAARAQEILLARGMAPARVHAVVHAIATHRFRGTAVPQTLEAQIVFDADKLDSIGAIGIARAYAVSGALKQRLWSAVAPETLATREQHTAQHTAFAEFVVKLSKVRDRLFTTTARQIAEQRHAFMVEFFTRLEREVRGEL